MVKDISARTLLLSLLDYLANEQVEDVIALEARYGSQNKRADLLTIGNQTNAYEIKSDHDTTVRLVDQLNDYTENFDFVWILTTQKHIKNVRKIAPKKVGLIIFDTARLKILRKPVQNRRLSRRQLAHCCTKDSLLDALEYLPKETALEEVIDQADLSLKTKELRELAICNFKNRFTKSSNLFKREANIPVRETDLLLLKRRAQVSLTF